MAACVAVSTAALQAQVQNPSGQNVDRLTSTITVVGCIQNAVADGSLGGTPLGTSATPADADVVANVQPQIEGYILTGARPAGPSAPPPTAVGTSGAADAAGQQTREELKTYALEGKIAEFQTHKGRMVEVSGTLAPPVSSGRNPDSPDTFKTGVQRLRVQTITKVADSCKQ